MLVRIYIHPEYKDSLWCAQTLKAINAEITQKRYTVEYIEADDIASVNFDELYKDEPKRILIYIGAPAALSSRVADSFSAASVHVIFMNYEPSAVCEPFSKILTDYRDGMKKIIAYLHDTDRKNIALYGINPNSATDKIKADFFASYLREHGEEPKRDIYYNYASLTGCYSRFAENKARYNAIICANDVAALSLLTKFKLEKIRVPQDYYIISFGSFILSQLSSPTLTSITVDHAELGRQAVLAYAYLYKNPGNISVSVNVNAELVVRGSTAEKNPTGISRIQSLDFAPDVDFFDDPCTHEIFTAEKLLTHCDELDFAIIEGMLGGLTYPEISDRMYTSENVISYRIKRMCKITGCTKKSEILALLAPYVDKAAIPDVVKNIKAKYE